MSSSTDIVTSRFQCAILAAILFQGLQFVATASIGSAAEHETPRRHSLIQHSAVGSAVLPATTYGTVLQSPGTDPTRITSGIEPQKPSISPTPPAAPHHRTLTKRPAVATITAPMASPPTPPAASISGVTDGQTVLAPSNTAKSTTPTVATQTHPGTIPAAAATVAPAGSSLPAGAAGIRATASAGDSSTPSSSGSRSASNLLKNPAIMNLLQPPAPILTTPPPLPPPSTLPSTPPSTTPSSPPPSSPSSPSTGSATLTWTANSEPDLAGYKIYVGTNSGTYNFSGSSFVTGKITSYTISNLPNGQTYFFAISAYDNAGNESDLSAEVSKSLY